MRATDIIQKKRGTFLKDKNGKRYIKEGTVLSAEEIKFMIDGFAEGKIPDYQMSAFLMAVYFNGMTFEETGILTECMLRSGTEINLHGFEKEGLTGPFIDKHSTGGVGDKISLPLAPIAAACGIKVPMMSGRALGHTGGTLDKLESIEGYNVNLTEDEFREGIKKNGFSMTGQTPQIAVADKKMYALRDVTATVESIPLITSSILSKKLAEGADGLVFDVKFGSGAFMKTEEDAKELAEFLVKTAKSTGKKACALLTDMNTPLGRTVGNFLEIEETVEFLQGKNLDSIKDVVELTYALAVKMIMLGGKAESKEEARKMCENAVNSGKALELLLKNVETQGGNPEKLLSQIGKRRSPFKKMLFAGREGFIQLDAYKTGIASVYLGVGRNKYDDKVCADSGFIIHKKTGDYVKKGELIMEIYGKDEKSLSEAEKIITEEALSYSENSPEIKNLILAEIE